MNYSCNPIHLDIGNRSQILDVSPVRPQRPPLLPLSPGLDNSGAQSTREGSPIVRRRQRIAPELPPHSSHNSVSFILLQC